MASHLWKLPATDCRRFFQLLIIWSCTKVNFLTKPFSPQRSRWGIHGNRHSRTCAMQPAEDNIDDSCGFSNSNNVSTAVIAGAGIIGCATAYYLAKEHGIQSILVDPTGTIAPAASGKAGGFLALDWNDHSPVGPLARSSFNLHQELANSFGADDIQYRRLTCAAIAVSGKDTVTRPNGKKLLGVEWASGDAIQGVRPLGNESSIAQVHPKRLCEKLWKETRMLEVNSKLVKGKVVGSRNHDGTLTGAILQDGTFIAGDVLLYACGPWTTDAVQGVKYHSIVVPTKNELSQCVFFSGCGDPEVYVRPDCTAYCTGFPDTAVHVTEEPGQEDVRGEVIAKIQQAVVDASGLHVDRKSSILQACYLPSTSDGLPIIGPLSGHPGCFVATGHSCWGILMGPATGQNMANLIATGKSHIDLAPFDPGRMSSMKMIPQHC